MRYTLRALSALLQYPSAELQAHIAEIRAALRDERAAPPEALRRLEPLLARLEREDLLDLQSGYTDLFDRSRALSLNLFEHVHGDSRDRGPAMIDLAEQYARTGVLLEGRELPDFVPVFVEFASCLPPADARETLARPGHVFAALAERLDERGSPYAAVFHALLAVAHARPSAEKLEALREAEPDESPEALDAAWEEPPVSFSTPAHEMGGPTGPATKVRALKKAFAAARG